MYQYQIVEAKVSYFILKVKKTNKKGVEKESGVPIRLGYKVVFADGTKLKIKGANGQIKEYVGPGTTVFFSFKHQSITITRPAMPVKDRTGQVVTDNNCVPQWEKASKSKGMTEAKFKEKFGKAFVEAVYGGFEQALQAEEEKRMAA